VRYELSPNYVPLSPLPLKVMGVMSPAPSAVHGYCSTQWPGFVEIEDPIMLFNPRNLSDRSMLLRYSQKPILFNYWAICDIYSNYLYKYSA